jgi:transposase InsO family protein
MEHESKKKIAVFWLNNNGKFISREFSSYCKNEGIKQQLIMSYTPQQNNIVERWTRSLLDITRCFLMNKNLWGETIHAATNILNLHSTKSHPDKTPKDLFNSHKSSVGKLQVFSLTIFVHQHPWNIGELENCCWDYLKLD